jgi:hypothetical protein
MQKIKRELYDKIINSKLSRLELHFLFYLAMRCDPDGKVSGVYYHSLCEALNCSVAKFYQLRDSLTKKGFISWTKNHSADIDLVLIGNQFEKKYDREKEDYIYSNYVDININIFHDEKFFKCKAGAIQMAMYFINRVEASGAVTAENSITRNQSDENKKKAELKRKLWFLPYNDYKILSDLLNVTLRMIKRYFEELEDWISVVHDLDIDGKEKDIITVERAAVLRPFYQASDSNKRKKVNVYPERYQYVHFVKTYCRRQGITYDQEEMLSDTADLIQQYRNAAREKDRNIFSLLSRAIQNAASVVLNSFNVHKALTNLLKYSGVNP